MSDRGEESTHEPETANGARTKADSIPPPPVPVARTSWGASRCSDAMTLAAAVAAILAAVFMFLQWDQMKKSLDFAERSSAQSLDFAKESGKDSAADTRRALDIAEAGLKKTEESLRITRNQLALSRRQLEVVERGQRQAAAIERANVTVAEIDFEPPAPPRIGENDPSCQVSVLVENVGRTRASRVDVGTALIVQSGSIHGKWPTSYESWPHGVQQDLAAGSRAMFMSGCHFAVQGQTARSLWTATHGGELLLWVLVVYEDVFGGRHRDEFVFQWNGGMGSRAWIPYGWDEHMPAPLRPE